MFDRVRLLVNAYVDYWFPRVCDREVTARMLADFYATRSDYHSMTSASSKLTHPQVAALRSVISPGHTCVEFGSGGGAVLNEIAPMCSLAVGFDISAIALKASRAGGRGESVQADIARVPLRNGCADIAYSFEVLEHVWDPGQVLDEMIRVLKPGGMLICSTPNGFGLYLHLDVRRPVLRLVDLVFAGMHYIRIRLRRKLFENMEPDLGAVPCYPDCDMITKLSAINLGPWLKERGIAVRYIYTFLFHRRGESSCAMQKRFEELEYHPFFQFFGDHIVFSGVKSSGLT